MMLYANIIVSFSFVHVGQAEWCVNGFDTPDAAQPWEDFENCEAEAAGGRMQCLGVSPRRQNSAFLGLSASLGGKTLLQGCHKACTNCEASGADTCDEASWPDKDHGIVCGECKVLVNNFEDCYRTCAGYCASLSLPCTGAWEGLEGTCTVKHEMTCDQILSSSDAICECNPALANGTALTMEWGNYHLPALAKGKGSVANDNVNGAVSELNDGSIRFLVSVIVGSSFVVCLLCLSACMFFRWKSSTYSALPQAARTLQKQADGFNLCSMDDTSTKFDTCAGVFEHGDGTTEKTTQKADSDDTQCGGSSDSDQSMAENAAWPYLYSEVGTSGVSEEKDAVPANGVDVGNPVNVGGNLVTPLSSGRQILWM